MDAVNDMLKAVLLNPNDDTARLIYADALSERAQGDDELWAMTIRYGVRWVTEGWETGYMWLRQKDKDFEREVVNSIKILKKKVWLTTVLHDYFPFKPWAHWHKGFIDIVHCQSIKEWEELKEFLYWDKVNDCPPTAQPLEEVTLPLYEWEDRRRTHKVACVCPGIKFSASGYSDTWIRYPTAEERKWLDQTEPATTFSSSSRSG